MQSGVYAIENIASGKLYVGSAKDFDSRWRVHQCLLRKGQHHSSHLQAAWKKFGPQAFVFKPILICDPENAVMYEQILIDGYRSSNRLYGYNAAPTAGSPLGRKHSEEAKAKVRAARARQVFSDETRALWSANRTGRKMPEWFAASVSARRKGVKHSDEAKAKMRMAKVGKLSGNPLGGKLRLTFEIAEQIRSEVGAGDMQITVAKRRGISVSTVSQIINGITWKQEKRR